MKKPVKGQRIECPRKPQKCPTCGGKPVARIFYGLPILTTEIKLDLMDGRVTLGGCEVTDDDPAWECTECGQKIYRKRK